MRDLIEEGINMRDFASRARALSAAALGVIAFTGIGATSALAADIPVPYGQQPAPPPYYGGAEEYYAPPPVAVVPVPAPLYAPAPYYAPPPVVVLPGPYYRPYYGYGPGYRGYAYGGRPYAFYGARGYGPYGRTWRRW
jgi:hypothetical protein